MIRPQLSAATCRSLVACAARARQAACVLSRTRYSRNRSAAEPWPGRLQLSQQRAAAAAAAAASPPERPGGPAPAAAAAATTAAAAQTADSQPTRFEELMVHARLTQIAQELWLQVLRRGDTAVDATAGNGHDTACLARAVGSGGTVHAFDVQAAALEATRASLEGSLSAAERPAVHLHHRSHAELLQHVAPGSARVVVFNLGYLPGSDKATTTQAGSTLAAVRAACEALRPGGLCSILCYTGHPGGQEEYEAVQAEVAALPPSGWVSSEVRLLNRPTAPVLLLLWKRA